MGIAHAKMRLCSIKGLKVCLITVYMQTLKVVKFEGKGRGVITTSNKTLFVLIQWGIAF